MCVLRRVQVLISAFPGRKLYYHVPTGLKGAGRCQNWSVVLIGEKRVGEKLAGLGSAVAIALVCVFGGTMGRRTSIRFSPHPFFFCLS